MCFASANLCVSSHPATKDNESLFCREEDTFGLWRGGGEDVDLDEDSDEEEPGPAQKCAADAVYGCSRGLDLACACLDDDEDEDLVKTGKKDRDIAVVAFLGCMDDFMVYFSIALADKVPFQDLIIGTALGAVIIALVVGGLLEASETLAGYVELIPVPLVLAALGVYIVVSAFWPALDV